MKHVFKVLALSIFLVTSTLGCSGGSADTVPTTTTTTLPIQIMVTSTVTTTTVQTTSTTKPIPTNSIKTKSSSTTLKPIADVDVLFEKIFSELQTADRAFWKSSDLVAFDRAYGKIKSKYKPYGVKFWIPWNETEIDGFKYIVNIRGTRNCRIVDLNHFDVNLGQSDLPLVPTPC